MNFKYKLIWNDMKLGTNSAQIYLDLFGFDSYLEAYPAWMPTQFCKHAITL